METDYPPKPQNAGGAESPKVSTRSVRAGHEVTDVSVAGLLTFFVCLAVFVAGTLAVLALVFRIFGATDKHLDKNVALHESGAASHVQVQPEYNGPILQVVPEEDLKAMNKNNDAVLLDYGWINQRAGSVRLPIDRAMALIAQRGLPSVSPGQTIESIQQQRANPQVYGQVLRP